MSNTTYTLKTNPAKYDNLHKCDQKYWKFSCDFSKAQDADTLKGALNDTAELLTRIVKCDVFKPENREDATTIGKLAVEQSKTLFADGADMAVSTFIVYQLQRWAFRVWYRDTKAARDAAQPKAEKKAKAPAKQEKKPAAKKATTKAPAKQEVAKANEATFVSKLTKAQKKELLLSLMAELLK